MANPARRYDETDPAARATDPINPVPPLASDPATDPRYRAANDPRVDNTTVVQSRSAGNGVLIAALVIVLAVIAYFIFAPGTPETTVPAATGETTAPDATAPAAPDATAPAAPDATAPAAPAPDAAAPAPDATAPAAPADGATTAPESSAPADSAPAGTAPAETTPAPAQ